MANQRPVDRPTVRTHKRQFAWQILVPFLVMAGLIIAGAVLAVAGGAPQTGVWADVSAIWLLAPVLVFALAILIIVVTAIYGMAKLLQVLPHYTGKAQGIFDQLSAGTRKVADGTTKPFVWFRQAEAVIKSLIDKL
jgi:phosphate/sulfate permease